jgi:hypothetical protein
MAEHQSAASETPPAAEPLHRRWLNIVYMRSRQSNAPLAPTWTRFQEVGPPGHGWLDLMENWERGGYRGEKPVSFDSYVSVFIPPTG